MASINFSNCIEIDKEISNYKQFQIRINGLYYWGDGYRTDKDFQDFRKMLESLKYTMSTIIKERYFGKLLFVEKDPNSSSCCEIKPAEAQYEPANVYLHPMEFTGILQQADIERLCDWINETARFMNRPDVTAQISYMWDTYHINDIDYISILIQNQDKIFQRVQEYLNKLTPKRKAEWLKYGPNQVGFDFAETCGIRRDFCNRHGFSSSDADVKTVQTLVTLAIEKGYIK